MQPGQISPIDIGIIVVYLGFMLAIGYYVARKVPNFDEYFIAGRTMTTPILICTLVSTYYGIDVTFGTSELAFNEGIVAWFGYSRPTYLFFVVAAFLLTRRLRRENYKSLPDVLQRYYGKPAAVFGALASFIYSLPSLGMFGLGVVFHVLFDMDPRIGGAIFGSVALLYTLWGGLWAVAITDTIQFVLLCVTVAMAVPVVMIKLGGFEYLAASLDPTYFRTLGGTPVWLVLVYASTGLTVLVDPAFYQRIFAARTFKHVRNALLIGILLWGSYDWCVTAGGMLAAGAVEAGLLPEGIHPNAALLQIVIYALPVGLTGIFLAGVLSAGMSSIDSYALVAGGNLVYDIYRPVFNPATTDEQLVRLTKWGVVVSGVIGYAVAFYFERLLALWVFMSTILTATVLVPILGGMFWKGRKTPLGGLLACAGGFFTCILYYLVVHLLGADNEEFGTKIWTFEAGGAVISLWQEYAIFISLPVSLAGLIAGNVFGRRLMPGASGSAA